MALTIDRAPLLDALRHLRHVVARRAPVPILEHILLEADDEELHLTATDMDRRLRASLAAEVEAPLRLAVDAARLGSFVQALPGGAEIRLATRGKAGRLELSCGSSRLQLATLPAEDFPAWQRPKAKAAEIDTAVLRRLLQLPAAVMGTEETRYYLCGLHLGAETAEDGTPRLCATATDGHTLLHLPVELPASLAKCKALDPGIILPASAVKLLPALLDGDTVSIAIDSDRVAVLIGPPDSPQLRFDTRLIDGTYPDYRLVVPPLLEAPPPAVVRAVFASAAARAGMAGEDSHGVHLRQDGDDLVMTARGDTATAEERIPLQGELPHEFGLNARKLDQVLHMATGDSLALHHAGPDAALRLVDDAAPEVIRVLMPMRTTRADLEG